VLFDKPFQIIWVIKKPEITKKISTPINPLGSHFGFKWNKKTIMTAKALMPSKKGM
jgi:hypothetical protein